MISSRNNSQSTDRQEPIVTYTRVVPRGAARSARPLEIERIEPLLTEAAVPVSDPPPRRVDTFAAAPEPHADVVDLDETFADEADAGVRQKRRPRTAMYLVIGALVAVAAGIGVLAITFNAATVATVSAPSASDATVGGGVTVDKAAAPAAEATAAANDEMIADIEARLAALEGKSASPKAARQVGPVTGEAASAADETAPAAEPVAPPSPRLRPEPVATATAAEPSAPAPQASAAPPPAPAQAGDDTFIATIERTLADSSPAPGTTTTAEPSLAPGVAAPAMEDGPALDMLPTSDIPVPPEPIPDAVFGVQ